MGESFLNGRVVLHPGDCLDVLARLGECSIDSCVTDPPYHLVSIVKRFGANGAAPAKFGTDGAYARASKGFMSKTWDGGDIAFRPETWAAVLRVLKPGAHALVFCIPKHIGLVQVAMQAAGFEFRDVVVWAFGSGFPKSHDVSKGIDRAAGAEREVVGRRPDWVVSDSWREQEGRADRPHSILDITVSATDAAREWAGWGTALKPAVELIVLARKPLSERTIAANVMRWGTGAINVDACRVETESPRPALERRKDAALDATRNTYGTGINGSRQIEPTMVGRWPANVAHDGSDEVTASFPETESGGGPAVGTPRSKVNVYGDPTVSMAEPYGANGGSAARFFFQAKQDDPCHSIRPASDAVEYFVLKSEHVVSALSHAVAITTERLALEPASYWALDMSVSVQQFALIVASVTEAIQNLERRFSLGLPLESITVRLGHAICVAIPNQIGTTTITVSLSTFDPSAEAVTFNIIETSAEAGERACAKRFHYTSKADADDRLGSKHPTVKPLDLMQWLVRLVTPKGGTVLDPFAGTGTTGEAAWREGMRAVLIEAEPEYQADIRRRMALALAGPDERSRESVKAKNLPRDDGPLFAVLAGDYDATDDFAKSIDEAYRVIRERKANGGEGWEPP